MNTAENHPPAAPGGDDRRRRRAALLLGLLAAATAAVLMPLLLRRSPGARDLPALPDLAGRPPAMARHLAEADAKARAAPDDPAAVGDLGRAYHADGFPEQALAAYARAEALAPAEWRWKYLPALILLEEGRTEKAVAKLREATALRGDRRLGWIRLGDAELSRGRFAEAEVAFEKARSTVLGGTNPPLPPGGLGITPRDYALFGLSRVYLGRGQLDLAVRTLIDLASVQPRFGDGIRLLAEALGLVGRIEEAEQARRTAAQCPTHTPPTDFEVDALARESTSKEFLLRQFALHFRDDNLAWSETLARRAVEVAPDDPETAKAMADVLVLASRFDEAVEWLDRYESLGGKAPEMRSTRADVLIALGRAGDAERYCRDLLAGEPGDPFLRAILGNTLFRAQRYEEAEKELTAALAAREDPEWRTTLGACRASLGRLGEAAAEFRRVLEVQPDHRQALGNLVRTLLKEEAWKELEEPARRMVVIREQPWFAYYALARSAQATGRKIEAIQNCERALESSPGFAPARELLDELRK